MPVELVKERWTSKINEVSIGATPEMGGTRSEVIKIGGESTLPFLSFEGEMPNPPAVALEVLDRIPENYPETLKESFKDVMGNPADWAAKCVQEYGAKLICLRLVSAEPEYEDATPDQAAETVKKVLEAAPVPLIIVSRGDPNKDNEFLPRCCEAARGENCLVGSATENNYKTIVVSCLADNHNIIAEAPIDINIQKQLNILISDMGFPLEKIVMDPTTGGLGLGIEYTYSIMERLRMAGLQGDKTVAMPMINFVGQEAWKAKEAKEPEEKYPGWGNPEDRGIIWEATTAIALLQAGSDILVMRHPKAAEIVRQYIQNWFPE